MRTNLKKRLKDKSDAPEAGHGTLPKTCTNSKKKDKATFYSPTNEWIMPAASTIKPEDRVFVVDSGANMHMLSRKDLNSADLETVSISKCPTTVVTATGEVLTREEATVYVKELDLFVTVMLLEETPAVLSLGKLCQDHGYTYHWTSGPKPHLTKKNGKKKHQLQKIQLRTIRCPWVVDEFLYFIFTCFFNIFIAGYCDRHEKSSNRKK